MTAHAGLTRGAAALYAGAVSGLLGTSALYHRLTWRPNVRRWMRRLDHSMIFVLIAATYTPVALVALSGTLPKVVLIVIWAGAFVGIVIKLAWIDAPKWLFAIVYVGLGWSTVAVFGELPAAIGWLGAAGFAAGGSPLHGRCRRLRDGAPEPLPQGVRLPRALPRARGRRGGAPLRRDRVPRAAPRLKELAGRAHPRERAVRAVGMARVADASAVAEEVHVQLELCTAGVSASIRSWSSREDARAGRSARRWPTRVTWVSTGTSRRPYAKSSTHAAVLRPTPGSAVR